MLTGYHWAIAHRPDAEFDYSHELPEGAFIFVEADSAPLYALTRLPRRAVLSLGVHAGLDVTRRGWTAYCQSVRERLAAAGSLQDIFAVGISEELYLRAERGEFDGLLGGIPWRAKADIIKHWLEETGIPVARQVFRLPVTVTEPYWGSDLGGPYRPVPKGADVLTIDPYIPAWALRTGEYQKAFEFFVERPTRKALETGYPVHLIGQAFAATDSQDLWGEFPPESVMAMTKDFAAAHPGMLALSWFCWADMPGVIGLRSRR